MTSSTSFLLNTSYYFIFALFLLWVWVLIKAYRSSGFNIVHFWNLHKNAIVLTFLAVILIVFSVPRYHRVLSDETVQLSVAQSMFLNHNVNYVTQAEYYNDKFQPISSTIETRPFLFPFFIHILHALTGYRTENVYILNYLALWGLLLSVYLLLRVYVSELLAIGGCVLVLTQPMICLSAASGSFEIFNSLFIALSFLSLRWFVTSRSLISFELLIFNLLMLANIRYESIIFMAVIFTILCLHGYITKKLLRASLTFVFVPFLLLSVIVGKIVGLIAQPGLSKSYQWLDKFKFEHIGLNVKVFFKSIFELSGSLGFAGLLNLFGVALLVIFINYLFLKKKMQEEQRFFFLLCLLVLLVHFIVVLAYGGGINSHPMNGRYYFPILILISVLPVVAMQLSNQRFSFINRYGIVTTLALFIYYHPVAIVDPLLTKLPSSRQDIFISDFLKKYADKNSLLICNVPFQYVADGKGGAIAFSGANKDKNNLLDKYKNHVFSNIFVVQEVYNKLRKPAEFLDPVYKLKVVEERGIRKNSFYRISKVELQE